MGPVTTALGTHQAHITNIQQQQQPPPQQQQQQQPQVEQQQIHQMPEEIHQETHHDSPLVDNMVVASTPISSTVLPTQTINLLGLRNVQITETPKTSNPILSRIKYSRGKIITQATSANMQIIHETHDNSSTQSVGATELSECGKYEISEIDLNNTAASATIISDLVKYAEIDDIELPDGTKIGIGFAPSDITEHQLQQTSSSSNTPQIKVEAASVHHHQLQLQNTMHNVQQQMRQLHDQDEATTSVEECILPDGIELQEQPLTKSYTILTTRPVKQELSGGSNSSLMASVEGLEVSNVSAECGESNTTTYELSLSDSSMHPEDTKYICRHCGKKYRWKSTLRRHENVECGGKEPCHPCPHCSYKAKQRGNLGVHVRKHHPDKPQLASKRGRK